MSTFGITTELSLPCISLQGSRLKTEFQFLRIHNFREILRCLDNFWRYLGILSKIFQNIFGANLGIYLSEAISITGAFY